MRARPILLAATILAASALAPGAASAGVVSLQGGKLVHVPSPGQNSRIGVTYRNEDDDESKQLLVTEEGSGATVTAGPGCRRAGDAVECDRSKVNTILVLGGDGDDTLYNATWVPATLDGQLGDDTLYGGWRADELIGGPGTDTADYSYRTRAITVDLDSQADDGAAGEGDNVASDVESITGGSAADNLSGGPGANRLSGGGGMDTIISRDSGADTVTCGSETDNVAADPADAIAPDCESVDVQATSPPLIAAPPPFAGARISGKPITMTRDGRALVRIACPTGRTKACRGTVTIRESAGGAASASARPDKAKAKSKTKSKSKAKTKDKGMVLGRRRFKIAPGQSKKVTVKLSRNGRQRVLRKRRVRCSVNVGIRGQDGKSVVTRKRVTVKAPKRGAKRVRRGRR
jgi:hypothetical protein